VLSSSPSNFPTNATQRALHRDAAAVSAELALALQEEAPTGERSWGALVAAADAAGAERGFQQPSAAARYFIIKR